MLIESPRFGTIEVAEERIFTFPDGLLGFRDFKRYYFHEPAPGAALKWMQCIDVPALGFVVTDPRIFKPDYQAAITAAELEALGITDPSQARVWVILTIPEDPARMTANLQGPLVTSPQEHLGVQIVLSEEGITTKYPVLEGLRAQGTNAN
ncbi:MAG: flagellar assembly protein FliW [Planctomycetes bacterium]|nr:flagellar assembly protein FliW [Planctomycetota bacterium]